MPDTGCRILDAGSQIPDAGYWILDTGYWILDTGYWIFLGMGGDILMFWVLMIKEELKMSYQDLRIYRQSFNLAVKIHELSLKLPHFEMYETGAQIRRSSKSVKSNIVEGYGRRRYKSDFIRFMILSLASNDETLDHLDTLYHSGSLTEKTLYMEIRKELICLGKEINRFIQALEKQHNNLK